MGSRCLDWPERQLEICNLQSVTCGILGHGREAARGASVREISYEG